MTLKRRNMQKTENSQSNTFYITTTLPYVNSTPHVGFAMEIIRADAIARYKRLMGYDVFFNTGTDEHGAKIHEKAEEAGKDTQEFVDELVESFKKLGPALNLSYDRFIRTTDLDHIEAAQEFWKRCDQKGDIYKKNYATKYCVGCELEKTDSELEDGRCPIHPDREVEIIEEENYFFRLSNYSDKLLEYYEAHPDFVYPAFRLNEMKELIKNGLQDFSISRLKDKMPWGVPVPGDDEHVMYVWFDALVNYTSTLGWPVDEEKFEKYWTNGTPVQYAGKDNVRQQSLMWQAMLMSAGLSNTHNIIINGFINSGGQKMSKSLGNVIDPFEVVEEYGTDALRYFVLRELHPFEDGDFTMERFKEAYNANLANGLGNLVSRILKMAEDHLEGCPEIPEKSIPQEFKEVCEKFNLQQASDIVWQKIGELDQRIQETEPFKLVKEDKEKAVEIIQGLVVDLYTIGRMLNPLLPDTSAKIKEAVKDNKKPEKPLFLRKD